MLDLNEEFEKRIDSGFRLSSLPHSEGKTKSREANRSPLSGYPKRIKDPDGWERLVEASLIPEYSSGETQNASPVERIKTNRQAPPLVVMRGRESRLSGSKAVAGGVLVGSLAIDGTERFDEGEEWDSVSADSTVTPYSPRPNFSSMGMQTEKAERGPSFLANSTMTTTAPEDGRNNTGRANRGRYTFPSHTAREDVRNGEVAERSPTHSPIPIIAITPPEEEAKTTHQALRESATHKSPLHPSTKDVERRGVSGRYPTFLSIPSLTSSARITNSRLKTRNVFRPSDGRQCPSILRKDDQETELVETIPNSVALKAMLDQSTVDVDDEGEAVVPDAFKIPERRLARQRQSQLLISDMTSTGGSIQTSESVPIPLIATNSSEEKYATRIEVSAIPTDEEQTRDVSKDGDEKGTKISSSKQSLARKVQSGFVFVKEDASPPPSHVSTEDDATTTPTAGPSARDLEEGRRHAGLPEVTPISTRPRYKKNASGYLVHGKPNASVTTSRLPRPLAEELEDEEQYGSTELSSSLGKSRHDQVNSRHSLYKDDQIRPLPSPSSIQKHALRPPFLLQYPDISLAHEYLSASWRQAASRIPLRNTRARDEDEGPFTRVLFEKVPLLSIPMQRYLAKRAREADVRLNEIAFPCSTIPSSALSFDPRDPRLVERSESSHGEQMDVKPPLPTQTASRLPRPYGSHQRGVCGDVRRPVDRGRLVERIPVHPSVTPSKRRYRSERDRLVPIAPLRPAQLAGLEADADLPVSPGRRLQRDLSQSERNLVQRHRVGLGDYPIHRPTLSSVTRPPHQPGRMLGVSNMVEEIVPTFKRPRTRPIMSRNAFDMPRTRPIMPRNAFEMPRTPPLPPSGVMIHDSGKWNTPKTIRTPSPRFPALERVKWNPSHGGGDKVSESENEKLTREMEAVFSNFSGIVRRPLLEQRSSDSSSPHLPLQVSPHHHERNHRNFEDGSGSAFQLNKALSEATKAYHEELPRYRGRPDPRRSERHSRALARPVVRGSSFGSFVFGGDHQWSRTGPLPFVPRNLGGNIRNAFSTRRSALHPRDAKTAREEGERDIEEARRRIEAQIKEEREGRVLGKRLKRWRYRQKVKRVLLCGAEGREGRFWIEKT